MCGTGRELGFSAMHSHNVSAHPAERCAWQGHRRHANIELVFALARLIVLASAAVGYKSIEHGSGHRYAHGVAYPALAGVDRRTQNGKG